MHVLIYVNRAPIALYTPFRARPWYDFLTRVRLPCEGGFLYPIPLRWRTRAARLARETPFHLEVEGVVGEGGIVSALCGESLRLDPLGDSILLRVEEGIPTLDPPFSPLPYFCLEYEIVQNFDLEEVP